ncbi:putative helicase [Cyclospora cayetanensis]|uniref:Helicase n=1 Tax=Cyclospora cayetanensis TaxID=88456 RepID=A0A1D3D356_9EIME|nr:putative helicase [Cyclospora cayetanensis]
MFSIVASICEVGASSMWAAGGAHDGEVGASGGPLITPFTAGLVSNIVGDEDVAFASQIYRLTAQQQPLQQLFSRKRSLRKRSSKVLLQQLEREEQEDEGQQSVGRSKRTVKEEQGPFKGGPLFSKVQWVGKGVHGFFASPAAATPVASTSAGGVSQQTLAFLKDMEGRGSSRKSPASAVAAAAKARAAAATTAEVGANQQQQDDPISWCFDSDDEIEEMGNSKPAGVVAPPVALAGAGGSPRQWTKEDYTRLVIQRMRRRGPSLSWQQQQQQKTAEVRRTKMLLRNFQEEDLFPDELKL